MKIVHDEIQFEESDLLDLDVTLSKLIYNALSAYRAKVIATNNVKILAGYFVGCTHTLKVTIYLIWKNEQQNTG